MRHAADEVLLTIDSLGDNDPALIANPDLPARIQTGHPLNDADGTTFFGGSEVGYIDYPAAAQSEPMQV